MMKASKSAMRKILTAAVSLLAGYSLAVEGDVPLEGIVTNGAPVLGNWYGYVDATTGPAGCFANCTNLAAQCNVPLLVLYSVPGCTHCQAFARNLNTELVQSWMKTKKVMFLHFDGTATQDGSSALNWILPLDSGNYTPVYRYYWKQANGSVRTISGSFAKVDGTQAYTGQEFIDQMEVFLAGYDNTGSITPYAGAKFACEQREGARLEMEAATSKVYVPLLRTGAIVNEPYENRLVVSYPSGTVQTNLVAWSVGQGALDVEVATAGQWAAGASVGLTLLNTSGAVVQERSITCVADTPNAESNPKSIGEPFGFGEWTMDLDAATNRSAAATGDAYTLVMFTGALWCPYCRGLEETVLCNPTNAEFTAFALSNQVNLVAIDNPRRDLTPPTLLRHAADATNRTGRSGSPYLSRHSVSSQAGEALLAKNDALQTAWKLPGADPIKRIGYPTLILLRKDGTIAGRASLPNVGYDTSERVYTYDPSIIVLRLRELLTLANDAKEEKNNFAVRTQEALPYGISQEQASLIGRAAELSANDLRDVYKLVDMKPGVEQAIRVTGTDAALPGGVVTLTLQGPSGESLGLTASGTLAGLGSVELLAKVNAVSNYFVEVRASTTDGLAFTNLNPLSTIRPYKISSVLSLAPVETEATLTFTNSAQAVQIKVLANQIYRLATGSGADFTTLGGSPESLGSGLYRWSAAGTYSLQWPYAGSDTLTFQLWRPGSVGFAAPALSVSEGAGSATVNVTRAGGGSGACAALVSLEASGTAVNGVHFAFPESGVSVQWADGEAGSKAIAIPITDNQYYEGDLTFALALSVTNGLAAATNATEVVTILENDLPIPGALAFTDGAAGYFAKTNPLVMVAREGATVVLSVSRLNGSYAAAAANLTATAGALAVSRLEWANNDSQPVKTVNLMLPTLAECPGKVVTVSFTPEGIPAVAGKSSLTIQLVPATAPAFETDALALNLPTKVSVKQAVGVQSHGGLISIAMFSGSLPTGVSAKYNAQTGQLVISGTPSRLGDFVAVFQVKERQGSATVAGLTLRVFIRVFDVRTVNPAALTSRSFSDYAVVDTSTRRVVGLFSFSLSSSGRISAKYQNHARSVPFTANNWTGCNLTNGFLYAELSASGGYATLIEMDNAGAVKAAVTDPTLDPTATPGVELVPVAWSAANPASDYEGYYTVNLSPSNVVGNAGCVPYGHSYMTLTLKAGASGASAGRVTIAGGLANGSKYSGSAVLIPRGGAEASDLGFFLKKSKDVLSGKVLVQALAKNTYKLNPQAVVASPDADIYWAHIESGKYLLASFDMQYEPFGAYYSSLDDLTAFYDLYEGAGPMAFFAEVPDGFPASPVNGSVVVTPNLNLTVAPAAITVTTGQTDVASTKFTFNQKTGIFSGSFKLGMSSGASLSATYAGVLLPGWTDCGCVVDGVTIPEKPFGLGAFWFSDKYKLPDNTLISVIRGSAALIDK